MNQRQTGGMGDELTNAALIGLIGMFGIALVLRAAGSITAFLTGLPQPDAGPAAGLGVLFNPADPATALGAGPAPRSRASSCPHSRSAVTASSVGDALVRWIDAANAAASPAYSGAAVASLPVAS